MKGCLDRPRFSVMKCLFEQFVICIPLKHLPIRAEFVDKNEMYLKTELPIGKLIYTWNKYMYIGELNCI